MGGAWYAVVCIKCPLCWGLAHFCGGVNWVGGDVGHLCGFGGFCAFLWFLLKLNKHR